MEKMTDLRDLLKHEIMDLYSAEEQIISALPNMIENAENPALTKLLRDHLKVTEGQLDRLKKIRELMTEGGEDEGSEGSGNLFSRLFGLGGQKCKGMEGIISEGEKIIKEDMTPEVKDAAILAAAQKVEHYEICGYGTARAYAWELGLDDVAKLLEDTLNEEYQADDSLTDLAYAKVNEEASSGPASTQRKRTPSPQRSPGNKAVKNSDSKASGGGRGNKSKSPSKTASGGRSKKAGIPNPKASKKSASTPASKTASKSTAKPGSRTSSKSASKTPAHKGSSRGTASGGRTAKAAVKNTRGTGSAKNAKPAARAAKPSPKKSSKGRRR